MRFDETLTKSVMANLEAGKVPMLLGEPGIGKSSWAEDLAVKMHARFFCLACNQLADKADVTGARLMPVTAADGSQTFQQEMFPHAVLAEAMRYAEEHPDETVLLMLDELNRTTPDVTSELLSIPTMRSIGDRPIPRNVAILTAGNDHGNVTSLDEASISRFVLYRVKPDLDTFKAVNPELNVFVKDVLDAHPEDLFCKVIRDKSKTDEQTGDVIIDDILGDDDGMEQITTPRTISALSSWLNSFGNDELMRMLAEKSDAGDGDESVLQELIEGHVGHTAFAMHLLDALASGLARTANTGGTVLFVKPACFDALKGARTVAELEDAVRALSDDQRGYALAYAIYDDADNSAVIRALAPLVKGLSQTDGTSFMKAYTESRLNRANLRAFLDTGSPLATMYAAIFPMDC